MPLAERAGKRKGTAIRSETASAQRTAARQTGLARVRAMEKPMMLDWAIQLAKSTPTLTEMPMAKASLSVSVQPKGPIE